MGIPRAASGKQLLPSSPMNNGGAADQGATTSRPKKSAYLGPGVPYAEVTSNSTAMMTQGNYLSEVECKSIEEAVAKEVLGDLVNQTRGSKTTGQKARETPVSQHNRSTMSKNGSQSNLRLMTFKELRELQKVASTSHVGPGTYNPPAEKQKNITLGKKYETKYNKTPGPGSYAIERGHSATRMKSASWNMPGKSKEVKLNQTMGPGDYDTHKEFGKTSQKFTIGTKSNYKPGNATPPPGAYEFAESQAKTLPNSHSYTMRGRGDHSMS